MTGAGYLDQRIVFQRPFVAGEDELASSHDEAGEWITTGIRWAEVVAMTGDVVTEGDRESGVQTHRIRIRFDAVMAKMDSTWRALDLRRAGHVYAIISAAEHRMGREWVDIRAELGGIGGQ